MCVETKVDFCIDAKSLKKKKKHLLALFLEFECWLDQYKIKCIVLTQLQICSSMKNILVDMPILIFIATDLQLFNTMCSLIIIKKQSIRKAVITTSNNLCCSS